jgi:hypothetical protein
LANQVVFLNFDGPTIYNCAACSDAPSNQSTIISQVWGSAAVAFPPYLDAAGRFEIAQKVVDFFAPYGVRVTVNRPATGPYTMVVVSPISSGRGHGVSYVDCANQNRNDIVFVYKTDETSADLEAREVAHELGHSFGLAHADSAIDIMDWASRGRSFTVAPIDVARASVKCVPGLVQDEPQLLRFGLAPR